LAGVNAAGRAGGGGAFVLDRADAYIGVMVDDLISLGTTEPYRMFTSRAEYRLVLRADNADLRLTPLGEAAGCVGPERRARFAAKAALLAKGRDLLSSLVASPTLLRRDGFAVNQDGVARSGWDLLGYQGVDLARLAGMWPELGGFPAEVVEQLEIEGHYRGYLQRQDADIKAYRREEGLALPAELDYGSIGSLSAEVRQKLVRDRPATLGAAARISGVTPAAVAAVLAHVRRSA